MIVDTREMDSVARDGASDEAGDAASDKAHD